MINGEETQQPALRGPCSPRARHGTPCCPEKDTASVLWSSAQNAPDQERNWTLRLRCIPQDSFLHLCPVCGRDWQRKDNRASQELDVIGFIVSCVCRFSLWIIAVFISDMSTMGSRGRVYWNVVLYLQPFVYLNLFQSKEFFVVKNHFKYVFI